MATKTVTLLARSSGRTRFSTEPFRVCNGTLFAPGSDVDIVTKDGVVVGTIASGQGLDVTGQDLRELWFQGAPGANLGFFGSVHEDGPVV